MKSSEHIERLAGGIRFRPDKEIDERILASAEDALGKKTFPDIEPEKMRLIIMRNPIIQIAAAAAIIAACLVGVSLWRGTQSGIALADVLARIEKVKAVRCKFTYKVTAHIVPDKHFNLEVRGTWLTSQEYGTKMYAEQLDPKGGESTFTEVYFLPQKRTRIEITPKEKRYWRLEYTDNTAEYLQKLSIGIRDLLAFFKEIGGSKFKSLGITTRDGNEVEVFQTSDPGGIIESRAWRDPNYAGGWFKNVQEDVKLWVDVKTRLPVRYESLTSADSDQGGDNRISLVGHDFQWDVPVEASEFEPVIPDDYTGTFTYWPPGTEKTAIQGLKLYADLSGNYPKRLDTRFEWSDIEKMDTPAAKRLREEIEGLTEEEKANRLKDALLPLKGLGGFYAGLQDGKKEPAYYGETVTPKDADKVLMRWKVSDSEYRVIYGDLHAETISSAKLAELEGMLPK